MSAEARLAPDGVKYDRQAVVNEAYYALAGEAYYYPTSDLGQWNYLVSDVAAYWHTRDYWTTRYIVNGNMTNAKDPVLRQYFIDGNLPQYGFYKNIGRGGQCKYFANMILYRASISDIEIVDPMPTYETMKSETKSTAYSKPGDIIFRADKTSGYYHTAIVAQVLTGDSAKGTVTKVQVIDSNYKGDEVIGKHIMYSSELKKYKIWTGTPYYQCNY